MKPALILLIALFVGLRPGTPPDVWGSLAAGRALLSGVTPWSADPFVADAGTWLPGDWLYDLAAYLLYSVHPSLFGLGHAALIVFAVWRVRRSTGSDLAALLAALAAGVWPFAGPGLVTLALTAWLLGRLQKLRTRPVERRDYWSVALASALWVNSDEGFRLAPLLVGLAAFTQQSRPLAKLAGVALLATLLHPDPLRHLEVPSFLAGDLTRALLESDDVGLFDGRFWAEEGRRHPGVWAAAVLIFVGGIRAWRRGDRFGLTTTLLGLGLAGLSARLLPVAAVLASPAWHGVRVTARWPARLAPAGLAFTAVLAWAGFTGRPPFAPPSLEPRPDPSMIVLGDAVAGLGEVRLFTPSPDAAPYVAWRAPGARVVADRRAGANAGDVLALRAALVGADPHAIPSVEQARELCEKLGVTHVACADRDPGRAALAATRVQRLGFGLAAWDGPALVFGHHAGAIDFHAKLLASSPPEGVPAAPRARRWYDAFVTPPARKTAERDAALLLIALADAERLRRDPGPGQWEALCLAQSLTLFGAGGPAAGSMLGGAVPLHFAGPGLTPPVKTQPSELAKLFGTAKIMFLAHRDDLPRDALLLALREGRRATALSPDDARAWLAVGEAADRLLRRTRERGWSQTLPALGQLRRAEATAAYRAAAALDPDLAPASVGLIALYTETKQLDRVLAEMLELHRIQGGGPGPLAEQVRNLAETVGKARQYAQGVASGDAAERAVRFAAEGLTGAALNLLGTTEAWPLRAELLLAAGDPWGLPDDAEGWAAARARWACGDAEGFDRRMRTMVAEAQAEARKLGVPSVAALVLAGPTRPMSPGEWEATALGQAMIWGEGVARAGAASRAAFEWERVRAIVFFDPVSASVPRPD